MQKSLKVLFSVPNLVPLTNIRHILELCCSQFYQVDVDDNNDDNDNDDDDDNDDGDNDNDNDDDEKFDLKAFVGNGQSRLTRALTAFHQSCSLSYSPKSSSKYVIIISYTPKSSSKSCSLSCFPKSSSKYVIIIRHHSTSSWSS